MDNDFIKMMIFSNIKNNNNIKNNDNNNDGIYQTIYDTIFTILLMISIGFITNLLNNINLDIDINNIKDKLKCLIYKKNILILEGSRCTSSSYGSILVSSTFSDRFKALWENIIQNIDLNTSIYEVKELFRDHESDHNDEENVNRRCVTDLFIVSQTKKFIYNKEKEIYAITEISINDKKKEKENNNNSNNNNNNNNKTERIVIKLFSFNTSLIDMIKLVDKITEDYLQSIQQSRKGHKFIYTLSKTNFTDSIHECWTEYKFDSTRTFENIYFLRKPEVIEKLNFFLENKKWYYNMGIPYSFGIGLYGPPGTGKTSLIKCIANMTNRHIVVLSLKMIKTRTQLLNFFYEDRYNEKNISHSIDFSSKIIVIEDIDCAGDIIYRRNKILDPLYKKEEKGTNLENVLKNIVEQQESMIVDKKDDYGRNRKQSNCMNKEDDPITLDDILNIWDGLKETPGRIMIISSNHYDKLDPALTRPGRIDLTLEMKNADHSVIKEIYEKNYKKTINMDDLKKINSELYSPAEVINIYILYINSSEQFMTRLMENKKI